MKRNDLQILLSCGCSISVDAKKWSCTDLEILANWANSYDAMLTIHNSNTIKNEDLVKIAIKGKGNVTFSFGV